MKIWFGPLILILTSSCASPTFPNGRVYSMVDGDTIETSYLYGVMLDLSGERDRITLQTAIKNRMICVEPDYFTEIMEWSKTMRKNGEAQ